MSEHDMNTFEATQAAPVESSSQTEATPASQEAPQSTSADTASSSDVPKFKVKVDGKETEVDQNELVRGYSHQAAASRRFNEAQALAKQAAAKEKQYETAINNLNYLASTNPGKVLEILGIDAADYAQKQAAEKERIESLPPEEKVKMELQGKISNLERQLQGLQSTQEQAQQSQVNAYYEQRFKELHGNYPEADPQYVAFICAQHPELKEEDVFKAEHDRAIKEAEGRFMKYRNQKREDAQKQIIATGGIPSPKKDYRKMTYDDTARMLEEMYGSGKKGSSW